MQTSVIFPQTEIGTDPSIIRDYPQAAEELGYSHLLVYDHGLDAGLESPSDHTYAMRGSKRPRVHNPMTPIPDFKKRVMDGR